MRESKLRSDVNWQGMLKQKGLGILEVKMDFVYSCVYVCEL
jgi:hypothetical protein